MRDILIVGAGGFAREVYAWMPPLYRVVGFYSEGKREVESIHGIPIWRDEDLDEMDEMEFIVAVGDPLARKRLYWKMIEGKGIPPCEAIIGYNVTVGPRVEIGRGSIICPGSVLTTDIKIGQGAIVNLNCTIGHDVVMGDFVTLSPGVNVSGNVKVGGRSYLGTNSSVREKVVLGEESTLGMGAALTRDLPCGETWVGVPAIKKR